MRGDVGEMQQHGRMHLQTTTVSNTQRSGPGQRAITLRYFAYHTAQILADSEQWFNVLMVKIVYNMQLHSPVCL